MGSWPAPQSCARRPRTGSVIGEVHVANAAASTAHSNDEPVMFDANEKTGVVSLVDVGPAVMVVSMVVVGGALLTFTLTVADVPQFPAASLALAKILCVPSFTDVVDHGWDQVGPVESCATSMLSTYHFTWVTPPLSEAEADRVVVPDTVEPAAGADTATAGFVVSDPAANAAIYVVAAEGVTIWWLAAPPSDHDENE